MTYSVLADLCNLPEHSTLNVITVILEVDTPRTIRCTAGDTKQKQNVRILDRSLKITTRTLWESFVGTLNDTEGEVVTLKNVRIRDAPERRTLTTTPGTQILRSQDKPRPEIQELQRWFAEHGLDVNCHRPAI